MERYQNSQQGTDSGKETKTEEGPKSPKSKGKNQYIYRLYLQFICRVVIKLK